MRNYGAGRPLFPTECESECVKQHKIKNKCAKYLIKEYCVFKRTTTCKFCSKSRVKRCYKCGKKTKCDNKEKKKCERKVHT